MIMATGRITGTEEETTAQPEEETTDIPTTEASHTAAVQTAVIQTEAILTEVIPHLMAVKAMAAATRQSRN